MQIVSLIPNLPPDDLLTARLLRWLLIVDYGLLLSLLCLWGVVGMAVRSNATTAESRADKLLAKGRLAAPVLLVAAVAFKNVLLDQNDHWYGQLNLLTQPEFFSAMLGFLTYKVRPVI